MVTEHLNFKKQKHVLFLVRKVIFYIVLNFKMCILIIKLITFANFNVTVHFKKIKFLGLRKLDYITAFAI